MKDYDKIMEKIVKRSIAVNTLHSLNRMLLYTISQILIRSIFISLSLWIIVKICKNIIS